MDEPVLVTRPEPGITVVTLNRPERLNALTNEMLELLLGILGEIERDPQCRAVILTGAGDKAFCAGADLQNSGAAFAMDFARPNVDYADLLRLAQNATKPAIARMAYLPRRIAVGDLSTMRLISQSIFASSSAAGTT